jgi:2-polyprenyl-3-methyl-5-hydroxy-6-metoxy-1,4-benzoquinol methylase
MHVNSKESKNCYLCNGHSLVYKMPYRTVAKDSIFQGSQVVECKDCGLLQINRKFSAEELENYYKHVYNRNEIYSFDIQKFPADNSWSVSRGRALAYLLKDTSIALPSNFTVMDLGCGYGHLLFGFSEHFKDRCTIIGVDYDPITKLIFEEYNWEFKNGGIDDVYQSYLNKIDVLITSHVFEHVTDPHDFLKKCSAMLKPEGVLVWEMPNLNAFNLECEERHSPHICLWDMISLTTVLTGNNFEILFLETAGKKYTWLDKKKPFNKLLKKIYNKIVPAKNEQFNLADKESIAFQLNKYGNNRRNLRLIAKKSIRS